MTLEQFVHAAKTRAISMPEWCDFVSRFTPKTKTHFVTLHQEGGAFGDYTINGEKLPAWSNFFFNAAILARAAHPTADIRSN